MGKTNPIQDWRFTPIRNLKKVRNVVGQRFGRLLCLGLVGRYRHCAYWACLCDCGALVFVSSGQLTRKGKRSTRSCGCLHKGVNWKHGHSKRTGTYKSWGGMKNRCFNQGSQDYPDYGGRGITVCGRWLVFENFLEDIGEPPTAKHSLDRKNNSGHYSCGTCEDCIANGWPINCRWATTLEQSRNRRSSKMITFEGETLSLVEWAERKGIRDNTLGHRIMKGWPLEKAMVP